jgi:hypothetical protein
MVMFTEPQGPIERFEWGRFQIDGVVHSMDGEGVGKDIFVVGRDVKPWKARKGHRLKPAMVACALEEEIDILVIGNGVNGAIDVTKKTRAAIKAAGIDTLIVENTPEACQTYNRLFKEGKRAALLAHGTC